MNTPKKIVGLIVIAVLLVGGVYIMTMPKEKEVAEDTYTATPVATTSTQTTTPKTTTQQPTTTTPTQGPKVASYTASQVATHNSSSSCWTIVNGNVYDVTSWISQHPGGQSAIKSMCGIDASDLFNGQHGGDGGPERILGSFKIGILK